MGVKLKFRFGFWVEGTAIYLGKRNNRYAKNHPY